MRPGGRLRRHRAQGSTKHLPWLRWRWGACQLTPPHDLIAAFARRWLREQVLTAKDWAQSPRTRRREGCKGQQQSRVHGAETRGPSSFHVPPLASDAPSRLLFPGPPIAHPSPKDNRKGEERLPLPPQGSVSPFASLSASLCSKSLALNRMLQFRSMESLLGGRRMVKCCHS